MQFNRDTEQLVYSNAQGFVFCLRLFHHNTTPSAIIHIFGSVGTSARKYIHTMCLKYPLSQSVRVRVRLCLCMCQVIKTALNAVCLAFCFPTQTHTHETCTMCSRRHAREEDKHVHFANTKYNMTMCIRTRKNTRCNNMS